MGPDELAVVDAQLRVRGLAALRIVDASIFPGIVGGNILRHYRVTFDFARSVIRLEPVAGPSPDDTKSKPVVTSQS